MHLTTGTIPEEVGKLSALEELSLNANYLYGGYRWSLCGRPYGNESPRACPTSSSRKRRGRTAGILLHNKQVTMSLVRVNDVGLNFSPLGRVLCS